MCIKLLVRIPHIYICILCIYIYVNMVIWVSAQPPHGMYTYIYTIHADICIYICIILLMVYRLETMICPAKLPLQGRGRD